MPTHHQTKTKARFKLPKNIKSSEVIAGFVTCLDSVIEGFSGKLQELGKQSSKGLLECRTTGDHGKRAWVQIKSPNN